METTFRRRKPAVERKIGEIRDDDMRVSLTGRAFKIDKLDYTFWLDDGTGVILIESEENFLPSEGMIVRVIGRVIRNENVHILGEIVQDFSDVDLEALEEIRDLENRVLPIIEERVEDLLKELLLGGGEL